MTMTPQCIKSKRRLTERTLDFDSVGGLNRLARSHGVLGGHTEVISVALEQLGRSEAEGGGVEVADGRPACPAARSVTSFHQVASDGSSAVHVRPLPRQSDRVPLDSGQTQA